MPENDNQQGTQATDLQQKLSKIASIGKIQKVDLPIPQGQNPAINNPQVNSTTTTDNTNNSDENNGGATATSDANNGGAPSNGGTPPAPTELNEDTLKEFFKSKGIEYDGLEKLKEKLNYKPENLPTPEQITEAARAKEKRVVDRFITGGGTYEGYTALKSVAEADLAELSKNALKAELKTAGFDETEIDAIIKERYYQITEEELEQLDEETDKAFAKRKQQYGANKLANRSTYIKNQAAGILADLQKVIESEDLQAKNELSISSNIEEQFKKLSRKETYEIGEINKVKIPPVISEVPEPEFAEAFKKLTDPAKRKQFFENQDGSVNYTNIAELLAENAKLKAAVKVSYHEGSTRTNAHWEKTFGAKSPYELGVGAINPINIQQNGKKVPASVGKVQRVMPGR